MCEAIDTCHKSNVLHSNLKPENIQLQSVIKPPKPFKVENTDSEDESEISETKEESEDETEPPSESEESIEDTEK